MPHSLEMCISKAQSKKDCVLHGLPCVTVTSRKAHEAICQFVLVDEGTELTTKVGRVAHCPIPITDDGLRDQRGEIVIVFPAHTFNCNSDICCWDSVVSHSDFRADEVRCMLLSGST